MLKDKAVIDCETYKDYFLLSALNPTTKKVVNFEMYNGKPLNVKGVVNLMNSYTTQSFNGLGYDLLIILAAVQGYSNQGLKDLSDKIITGKVASWKLAQDEGLNIPASWDHIDVMNVAPGMASLKIYGGRLGMPTIQDLPIEPSASIPPTLRAKMRKYCINDLETTLALFDTLKKQIALRVSMSKEYGVDLRSKSDAQIAETVIKSELNKLTGKDYRKKTLNDDFGFFYKDPEIVSFKSPVLKAMFAKLLKTRFELGGNGSVIMPAWLKAEPISINNRLYKMGIGGLHSREEKQFVTVDSQHLLFELDVASYYPNIILQQELAPASMGKPFLDVYKSIVERRIIAKRAGDKVTADTLKICVNGSFGKLGSKYSALYAPEMLIQTTVTGQLCLLMLIEMITALGVEVVSANTDGIVVLCHKSKERAVMQTAFDWELETSYELERTNYTTLASRDVNNYLAVHCNGDVKGKGVFAKSGLAKNPDFRIVYEAVAEYLKTGTPLATTIHDSTDIKKFVSVRRVNGGAVWRGENLGKAVRFYYSTDVDENECISYATNSNKVPKSSGARPLMTLPDTMPKDINYELYRCMAHNLLIEVGVL